MQSHLVAVAHLVVVVDVEVRWFTLEWPPAQEVRHQQQGQAKGLFLQSLGAKHHYHLQRQQQHHGEWRLSGNTERPDSSDFSKECCRTVTQT